MSYSAITEIGTSPVCSICEHPILGGQEVALVLVATAAHVPSYNEENELEEGTITVDMDWKDQTAFHATCFTAGAEAMLKVLGRKEKA